LWKKVGITAASNFRLELLTVGRVDMGFPSAHAALREWAMLIDSTRVRNPANEMALVGMERDLSPADLRAMRTGIGAELRTLYSDVLREKIPDRIAELLWQLDQQLKQLDQKDRDST
jgi:Anti-sigma factor NepR